VPKYVLAVGGFSHGFLFNYKTPWDFLMAFLFALDFDFSLLH